MIPRFPKISVSDLVASGEVELKTGPFGTQLKASDYVENGIPVINVRNIGFGTIRPDKLEFISNVTRDRLSAHVLRRDDIVFGRKGAVERHVFIKGDQDGWFQGSDCLRLRINSPRIDARFASYYFLTEEHQQWMKNQCSHAATMASLNQGILERIELPTPPLPTQRKIAGILSAYDDLIENNLRRIKILEEMAQSLYREWFVHFRFPGHESAKLVDSPLGQIPLGWEVKPLFDVATVKYGRMLPKKDLSDDGPFPVYGAAKVIGRHNTFTREDRTIICGCRGSVGEMQITEPRCFVTNNSFTFDPVSPDVYFWLFHTLSERGLRDVTGGAAQPQITLDGISQVFLAAPPDSILAAFEKRSRALAELAWNLKSKNQTLRRTRDLLIPHLLTFS